MPHRPERMVSTWRMLFGEARRNVVQWWPAETFRTPHVSRATIGTTYHAISDPEAIKRVLLDNAANYGKPALLRRIFPLVKDGLFGVDSEPWRSQRRLMAPVFTPASIAEFFPTFAEVGRRMAEDWTANASEVVDMAAVAQRAALDVVSRTLFSNAHGLDPDAAASHVRAMLAWAGELRPGAMLGLPWLDVSPLARPGKAGEAYVLAHLSAFIAARQADRAPADDFMTRLLEAFAADHPPKEAAALVLSNAVTFLVAGHETTANAITWTLYLLSEQPQAQAWAAEEARDALGAESPAKALSRLTYLKWVLEEAMRLYPPVPRIERQALEDDRLGDLAVRKGELVGVWPWVVHRHEALWEEPDVFNPENFSPEARAGHHRFQYLPFGAGPRICIGAQFATAEALLILAEWLARFVFAPMPGRAVEVTSDLTLRPKGGLPLRLSLRP
jgi:cytochrome P450